MKIKNSKTKALIDSVSIIINICFVIIIITVFLLMIYNVFYVIRKATVPKDDISIFGISSHIIDDNSMSPALKKYDIVFAMKYKNAEIQENDIIVFYDTDRLNVSRIQAIQQNDTDTQYITKRDNNYYYDSETIKVNNIKGKVCIKIPLIGGLILIARSNIFTAITGILILLLLVQIIRIRTKSSVRKKKINNQKDIT